MEGVITIKKQSIPGRIKQVWVASSDKRERYCFSACKPCVIKIMLGLTKKSKDYHVIEVYQEDGNVDKIPTGVLKESE